MKISYVLIVVECVEILDVGTRRPRAVATKDLHPVFPCCQHITYLVLSQWMNCLATQRQ